MTGTSGHPNEVPMHPVIQDALPRMGNDVYPNGSTGPVPSNCAEPRAMSEHLRRWEEQNGTTLDPNNKAQVGSALSSITGMGASQTRKDGVSAQRCPCANCSQMLAHLMTTYGGPDPGVITPGHDNKEGKGATATFTPPAASWPGGSNYSPYGGYPSKA